MTTANFLIHSSENVAYHYNSYICTKVIHFSEYRKSISLFPEITPIFLYLRGASGNTGMKGQNMEPFNIVRVQIQTLVINLYF
jgi:hypothetical protein